MSIKNSCMAACLGLLVCLVAAPSYSAEEAKKPGDETLKSGERPEGAPGAGREELIKKFDKNGNGQLDPEEREAALAERQKNRPAGNPGERTDRKPRERLEGAPGAGREELIKKFDKNGNGQLDPEEREAAMAERQKNRPAGNPGERTDRKPRERLEGAPGAGREELIKKFDKNGNGQLDPEEREAAMAERQKNRPAGNPGERPESKPGERPAVPTPDNK